MGAGRGDNEFWLPWADKQKQSDPEEERLEAFASLREGRPLYTLPVHLRSDKEIVLAALAREGAYCYDYIGTPELRTRDRDVGLELVRSDGSMLKYLSAELRDDRQIVQIALRTSADALSVASKALQADKELKNQATARYKEEQKLMKHYAAKACGPGAATCTPVARSERSSNWWFW